MIGRLAKTDTVIQADAIDGNPRFQAALHLQGEKISHFLDDVGVVWVLLHGLGSSLDVHQADADMRRRLADIEHAIIKSEPGNIIHDGRSGLNCLLGHLRLGVVDLNWNGRLFCQLLNDGDCSAQFFFQ